MGLYVCLYKKDDSLDYITFFVECIREKLYNFTMIKKESE